MERVYLLPSLIAWRFKAFVIEEYFVLDNFMSKKSVITKFFQSRKNLRPTEQLHLRRGPLFFLSPNFMYSDILLMLLFSVYRRLS